MLSMLEECERGGGGGGGVDGGVLLCLGWAETLLERADDGSSLLCFSFAGDGGGEDPLEKKLTRNILQMVLWVWWLLVGV